MKIKRFNELSQSNIDDADIVGITKPSGQRRLS